MEGVLGVGDRGLLSGGAGQGRSLQKRHLTGDQEKIIYDILSGLGGKGKVRDINRLIAEKCPDFELLSTNQLDNIKKKWRQNFLVPGNSRLGAPIGELLWSLTQKEIAYKAVMRCCEFCETTGKRKISLRGARRNEQIQRVIAELCEEKKEPLFQLEDAKMSNLIMNHFQTWCSLEDFVVKPISIGLMGSAQKRCRESAPWSLDQKQIFYAAAITCCKFDEMGRRMLKVTSSAEIQKEIDEECKRRGIPSFQPVKIGKFLKDHFNSKEVAEKFIHKDIFLRCCDPVDSSGSLREEGKDIKRRKEASAAEISEGALAGTDSGSDDKRPLLNWETEKNLGYLDACIQDLLRGIPDPFVGAGEPSTDWFSEMSVH